MKKLRSNEYGFNIIELVLIIVIIALIGFAGWLVYKDHHKSMTATAITTVNNEATSTPKTSNNNVTTSNVNWLTYVNSTVGFSIKYPQLIYADSGCTQSSNGSGTTIGNVPTTVIQDGNNYYVITKTSYQMTLTWGANQTYNFTGCSPVPTTANTIQLTGGQISNGQKYIYKADNFPFVVEEVNSESDVTSALQSYWNDNTITISGWKNSSNGVWQEPVSISCSSTEVNQNNCGPTSSNYDLRYYSTQKLMFYFVYGQAAHLILPNNGSAADTQIVNSFMLL
ncbi:MAG: hypothetical protein ABSB12_00115 [Candidatus Saccharimonadales bacterium]|jgi:Tfp pilus assembly protein PilE